MPYNFVADKFSHK